ncbi:hypothetical protein PPTG_21668 [Phytophthora nicotianae INRA-310]|uniref:Uncharacterized protein n=1 Tax=Phytophthora nicotianae (strain INRA-310) TaxID=761204 RepID=W2QXD4_PHYN3|nr:hypothetical protein PPTG_21668 [Phytophthora nicotianae INRA-310]ETN17611.1 hypothetical protein PPTG_21668 [Phytophthora nicotianae INRA-310]
MNRIEGVWEVKTKQRIKDGRGTRKTVVARYLGECMWRKWHFSENPPKSQYFQGLITEIRAPIGQCQLFENQE